MTTAKTAYIDRTVSEISELAKIWYSLGKSVLPTFGTRDFVRFAAESYSLIYSVDPKAVSGINIKSNMGGQIGYIDSTNKRIYISSKMFQPELYLNRLGEDAKEFLAELAISLFNGTVVHEALHSAITFANDEFFEGGIPEMVATDERSDEAIEKYGLQVVCRAFNIIEDLFIESHVPERLEGWLQSCRDILFRGSDIDEMEAPQNYYDLLNYAVAYKQPNLRNHPKVLEYLGEDAVKVLKIASSGKAMSYLRTRAKWTFDLLEALELPEPDEDESESDDSDESSDSGDESNETESESQVDDESTDEDEETDSSSSADEDDDETNEDESETDSSDSDETDEADEDFEPSSLDEVESSDSFSEMLSEIEDLDEDLIDELQDEIDELITRMIIEKNKEEREAEASDFSHIPSLVEYDVLNSKSRVKLIKPKTDFDARFLKELQAIRTVNRAPGRPRKYGSVMVKSRLTRIATDGKIFARRTSERSDGRGRQKQERMEVIINIDLSSSTYHNGAADSEVGAAIEISKALQAAQIPHSIYAHSGSSIPTLYHVYSFRMEQDNKNFDERLEALCYVNMSQNYDGFVISELGEKFTGKKANRFLINLSDGLPCGHHNYAGYYADEHTKEAIETLRKRGIAVFSISVIESVVENNDGVYGKEWNLDGSTNLSQQFRNLMTRLATGQTV